MILQLTEEKKEGKEKKKETEEPPLVGYYSKKESLIAESESLLYPFSVVLESLVNNAKEAQQLGEKIDSTLARVKKGLLKFAKEQGIRMGIAILEDLAKKVGLDQTLVKGEIKDTVLSFDLKNGFKYIK